MLRGTDRVQVIRALSIGVFLFSLATLLGCNETNDPKPSLLLTTLQINNASLLEGPIDGAPIEKPIIVAFNMSVDTSTVSSAISLTPEGNSSVALRFNFSNENKNITIYPRQSLATFTAYTLSISEDLIGAGGKTKYIGGDFSFTTLLGKLTLESFTAGGIDLTSTKRIINVPLDLQMRATFSSTLSEETVTAQSIKLKKKGRTIRVTTSIEDNVLILSPDTKIDYLTGYDLEIDTTLKGVGAVNFDGFNTSFITALDSTLKFPEITDDELLTKVQQQTFKYFWDFGHPVSGLARERNTSGETVTSGGSGFGLMSIIVGIERGFITREVGVQRLLRIVNFLQSKAERFHGAWSHWLNGTSGKVIPFGADDNGGDLVETAFMVQGLLTVRQYMNDQDPTEAEVKTKINELWESVEWDWYTQNGQNALYWHWSPNFGWQKNFKISGWNEALIIYVLAASSTTHGIEKPVYDIGWARNGSMKNGSSYYNVKLPLGENKGGPLFFTHYSFLGLDPRNLTDKYANYWEQNVNHSKINYAYCVDNPRDYSGYSAQSWGLTASDNDKGYNAHSPTNDLGVISPTAAISALPYAPEESMAAIRHFYYILGDRLWGNYGFYDAFNFNANWTASSYLAIDQGPIVVMIENYRTGLLWDLFMSSPEIQNGLTKLGFTYE